MYVNSGPSVEVPPSAVTTTSTVPAACAGVLALISVSDSTSTSVASPPSLTFAPSVNPVPVITTFVPPAVAPVAGSTDSTVGRALTTSGPVNGAATRSSGQESTV